MHTFEDYCADLPALHSWDEGKTWNTGGLQERHLQGLFRFASGVAGGASILETGAGNSTLAFLFAKPRRLVSIAPDAALFARIQDYCRTHDLDPSPLEAVVRRSEIALPQLAGRERGAGQLYDLALLDGGHGWPTVFVDFCYANVLLRRGGILLVDDVQLHSVKELARLLVQQPEFRLVEDLGKVQAFEKLTDEPFLRDHGTQPYIVARTAEDEGSPDKYAL